MAQKKKQTKNLIVRLMLLAFVIYASVVLIDMQVSVGQRKKELAQLQVQYEQQRIANKELERQLAIGDDKDYIERVARDKLDYVAPEERVFIDVSGN
ncbi:septum formation initiator family protein [Oscillospiraceae bacterium MB08-C2-2]|nr:septum formation initiator family protein [Oscillospiraceae bacterium MB08-C2-2]